MKSLFDLSGKVALITGSSKGIGRAIAEEMAHQGAQVVISSRKSDVCQSVTDSINLECDGRPGGAISIPAARQIFLIRRQAHRTGLPD